MNHVISVPDLGGVLQVKAMGRVKPIHGRYEAKVVPFFVPKAAIQSFLDKSLELAPNHLADRNGDRLVVMTLGRQTNVRQLNQSVGISYYEAIVYAPYVRTKGQDAKLLTTSLILYLDKWIPVFYGWKWYGFPKKYSRITASENGFEISNSLWQGGKKVLSASFETDKNRKPIAPPEALGLPAIQRKPFGSLLTLNFQSNTKEVYPLSSRLGFTRPIFPGWPTGEISIPALSTKELGAFEMISDWVLE